MAGVLAERLGKLLVEAGVITDDQLEEALSSQDGNTLGQTLVSLGFTTEPKIAGALAESMHLEFIDLANYEVDATAATSLSEDLASRYKVLPIGYADEKLLVAMADPANIFAIDDLRIVTGFDIQPVVATESEIEAAIKKYSRLDQSVEEMVDAVGLAEIEDTGPSGAAGEDEAGTGPVVKLVNLLITEAVRERANDVHIEPQERDVRIRFRVDGVLHEVMRSPKKLQNGLISRIKIMSGMDIAERRVPQDGRFGVNVDKKSVDFRVASLPTIHGEKIVLRLLEKESILMSLDDLGFLPESLVRFKESFTKPYGAILITGPTGSGKTTTLYGALNILNDPEKNCITVEDPVEYRLHGLGQCQVNVKAGMTFAAALRSILRQDPDIVMIGEIRDQETALIAIESALTGHLVLSTLHTNDAASSMTRLTEMGVEPFLSSSAVDCIVAQRLARRLCKECKQAYTPTVEALQTVRFPFDEKKGPPELYRAVGCKRCGDTGYRGRVGVYEVLRITESIERLVVERASTDVINRQAVAEGMDPLRGDGFKKVAMGLTSIEEIMRVIM
jgi:type IV pilus assembly protein PilB